MRYLKIDNNLFRKNREKLLKLLPESSVAIVCSNAQMPRNGDQFYTYRQNSDFFYLSGIEQEKSVLFLKKDDNGKDITVLFIIKPNKLLETWEGKKLSIAEARSISGINEIKFIDDFDDYLHQELTMVKNIFGNLPENPRFQSDILSADRLLITKLKEKYPLHNYDRLAPFLTKHRLVKETEEIELIKKACQITKEAFIDVLKNCKPTLREYQLEAIITQRYIAEGAMGHAYNPIVASGKNACYLHYDTNDDTCNDGELVLFDIGAEYANYAADLSRTIPVNGKFSARQKELYEATLGIFKKARNLMKPGITINQINEQVEKLWEKEHIQLGLYNEKDITASSENLCKKYYPHGTSHFMGLDVHDVGGKDVVLEPGMIITCEPGIYIEEEETGIRIENDILITENGNIDLMKDIPVEIEEIEKIMNGEG